MGKKFGVSFSAKRALGISGAKTKIARATGIPTTKQGRQRKIGRAITSTTGIPTKGSKQSKSSKTATAGCLLPIILTIVALTMVVIYL